MKPSTILKLKKFISILLAILLISSFVLLTGCKSGAFNPDPDDEIEEPEDPEEEEEILEVIKNGKFDQYGDLSTTDFPVRPNNWSYFADSYGGQSAPASFGTDIRYGTISTKKELYDANSKDFKTSSMKDPLDNPGYPKELTDAGDTNDKILMLENIKKTAAKYKTSSSISVPANSYAIISVWVYTKLIGKEGDVLAGLEAGQGATISITGGVDKPVILHGIDTHNIWKEYQFIIEGSSVSNKSITLELGLGTGYPSNDRGYTEGFAFFANAQMKYITQKEFKAVTATKGFTFEETNYGKHEWLNAPATPDETTIISYSFKNDSTVYNLDDFFNNRTVCGGNEGTDFTISKTSINNLSNNLKGDLTKFPFANDDVISIEKTSSKQASAGIFKNNLVVREGGYYKISFWAKTSEMDWSGLNVYLSYVSVNEIDAEVKYKEILNIETTKHNLTKEEADKVTNDNKWDDWRQYSFYVDAGMFERNETIKNLSLEIWFGSVNISYAPNGTPSRSVDGFNKTNFPEKNSYALITDIEIENLFRSVYSSASTADNSMTGFSLSNRYGSNSLTNGSFNNVTASDSLITNKPMSPANFTGSYRPGAAQGNVYGGIVNTNLKSKYEVVTPAAPWLNPFLVAIDILKALQGGTVDAWNSLLMIYNQNATAYGYASDKIDLKANSYTAISVSVKTMGQDAKANIYLVDSDGKVLGNYILDKYGENKISGTDLTKENKASVYNPFYDEKYDEANENGKYGPEASYDKNSDENKLLRKGTKLVPASTIPVENPFYVKDYDPDKDTTKDAKWKKDLKSIKYFVYDKAYYKNDTNLYKIIEIDYNKEAEFSKITTVTNPTATVTDDLEDFVTYTFFIKTGNTPKSVNLELWNGSKYSNDDSVGAVFFDVAIQTNPTNEQFYDYVFNKKIYNQQYNDDTSMFFDMSGYDNIPDPKAAAVDPKETPDDKDGTPFDWINLLYIIPTSAMVVALVIVVIRKLMQNKKTTEETVTEAPAYTRGKTSKKSTDDHKK